MSVNWHDKVLSIAATADIKAVSGAAADTEKPAYFQPLPAEDLRTGGLPTICCMEDIKASNLKGLKEFHLNVYTLRTRVLELANYLRERAWLIFLRDSVVTMRMPARDCRYTCM